MKLIRATLVSFFLLTLLTGVVYPLVITGIAKALFPHQADGSLIDKNGNPTNDESAAAGSSLIGQTFDQPQYFWSRPSATSPMPYNAASSSGSNLGPSNPALIDAVKSRIAALQQADQNAGVTNRAPVPIDLVTASASGLDPHESIAAAEYQIPRIAKLRNIPEDLLKKLVAERASTRQFGFLGEPCVNVLTLNLALDRLYSSAARKKEVRHD